jgi:hypothetical protein
MIGQENIKNNSQNSSLYDIKIKKVKIISINKNNGK